MVVKVNVLVEKRKRTSREELWRGYMTNAVSMWSKEVRGFGDVLKDYEDALKPEAEREKEKQAAYDAATAAVAALEQSRG